MIASLEPEAALKELTTSLLNEQHTIDIDEAARQVDTIVARITGLGHRTVALGDVALQLASAGQITLAHKLASQINDTIYRTQIETALNEPKPTTDTLPANNSFQTREHDRINQPTQGTDVSERIHSLCQQALNNYNHDQPISLRELTRYESLL